MVKTRDLWLRGSLIVLRRKCGKAGCKCNQGEKHETPALSYSLKGTTKILTLRPQDLATVKAALRRYQKQTDVLEMLALRGIENLRVRIEKEKKQARKSQ